MRFRWCRCPETPWPRQTAVREAGSTALVFLLEAGVPGPDRRGGLLALRVCVALLPPGNVTAFHRRTLWVSRLRASAPFSSGPRARGDAGAEPALCPAAAFPGGCSHHVSAFVLLPTLSG